MFTTKTRLQSLHDLLAEWLLWHVGRYLKFVLCYGTRTRIVAGMRKRDEQTIPPLHRRHCVTLCDGFGSLPP